MSYLSFSNYIYYKYTGYLSYGDFTPMEYTVGDNITFKVEIIGDNKSEHIQSFGWFFNNTPLCVCSGSTHYIFSKDSKKLTIVNASVADVGTYEARVTSYNIPGYSAMPKLCDTFIMKILEYHAAFAPVTYTLHYKSKKINSVSNLIDYCASL